MDDSGVGDERTGSVAGEAAPTGGGRRRVALMSLLAVAVAVVVIDIVTKALVVAHIDRLHPVHLIGDFLTLRLVRNSGAAFSVASGYTWILTIVALAVVVVIVRFSARLRSGWWVAGLGLVLGGAIGNLIDRVFRAPGPLRGHVVDFISVGWWPVFNAADSAVVCGAVLLVLLSLIGVEYDGSRSGWAARRQGSSADASGTGGASDGEDTAGGEPNGDESGRNRSHDAGA